MGMIQGHSAQRASQAVKAERARQKVAKAQKSFAAAQPLPTIPSIL
jgi:hypothetical protein